MASLVSTNYEAADETPPDEEVIASAETSTETDNNHDEEVIGGQIVRGDFSRRILLEKYGYIQANGSSTTSFERIAVTNFAQDIKADKQSPEEIRAKEQQAILDKITDPIDRAMVQGEMQRMNLIMAAFNEKIEQNVEQLKQAEIARQQENTIEQRIWTEFLKEQELGLIKQQSRALSMGGR